MGLFDWLRLRRPHAPLPIPPKPPPKPPPATVDSFRPEIRAHARTAWTPVVEEGEGGPFDSRFGGTAGLLEDEAWPACGHCRGALKPFLQMNLAELPKGFGTGLLQFFYCVSEKCDCPDMWSPFAKNTLVRIVDPARVIRPRVVPIKDLFPPRRVKRWEAVQDLPSIDEFEEMGVELTAADEKALEDAPFPLTGDKLGGWPYWVQNVEYPACTKCGKTMRLVFQIDSEDHIPFMWGDVGCGHITQCQDHSDVLAFGWACC